MLINEQLTESIIGAAIEVHKEIGVGLLESSYEQCLCRELSLRGIKFQYQVPMPINYKGMKLDCGHRLDLLVEDRVIVELKAVEKLIPIHEAQLLTYMRLSRVRVGLLINFNVTVLKDGLVRRVL
jgi:GxxExxY protein